MIIKAILKNWLSYRDKCEVSMVATREQHHGERVAKVKRLQTRLLPIAMIFGGNASGKSNFFRALEFAQYFIVKGNSLQPDARIKVEPFLLDKDSRTKPTTMGFTILVGEDVYEYEFSINSTRVLHEKLVRTTAPAENVRFERHYDEKLGTDVYEFGKAFAERTTLMNLISKVTRRNQLFLSASVMHNLDDFRPVYDWFSKTLCLISPNSHYAPKEAYADESAPNFARMNELLATFDTGIKRIVRKPVEISALPIPTPVIKDIADRLVEGQTVRIENEWQTWSYLLSRVNGEIVAEKLVSCHGLHDACETEFELDQESDGTKRILDLLPAFVDMERHDMSRVYVIDEIDRCLHTYAGWKLVKTFLDGCTNDSRAQLLCTTHDNGMMNQELLRRDEMWLAERNEEEVSTLFSISDFAEARKDTDLRTSYLSGRMGGLPSINIH